MSTPAPQDQ